MKTCPPEVFWTAYHTHKYTTCKLTSTFETWWKNDIFWPNFYLQSTFSHVWSTRLVLTKIFREKKFSTFAYTTLISDFSYLLWSRKYFVLKIKYTKVRFSNNYLHCLKKIELFKIFAHAKARAWVQNFKNENFNRFRVDLYFESLWLE